MATAACRDCGLQFPKDSAEFIPKRGCKRTSRCSKCRSKRLANAKRNKAEKQRMEEELWQRMKHEMGLFETPRDENFPAPKKVCVPSRRRRDFKPPHDGMGARVKDLPRLSMRCSDFSRGNPLAAWVVTRDEILGRENAARELENARLARMDRENREAPVSVDQVEEEEQEEEEQAPSDHEMSDFEGSVPSYSYTSSEEEEEVGSKSPRQDLDVDDTFFGCNFDDLDLDATFDPCKSLHDMAASVKL
eukprot:jgi/Mesvir1/17546/Mv26496-RA.1